MGANNQEVNWIPGETGHIQVTSYATGELSILYEYNGVEYLLSRNRDIITLTIADGVTGVFWGEDKFGMRNEMLRKLISDELARITGGYTIDADAEDPVSYEESIERVWDTICRNVGITAAALRITHADGHAIIQTVRAPEPLAAPEPVFEIDANDFLDFIEQTITEETQ